MSWVCHLFSFLLHPSHCFIVRSQFNVRFAPPLVSVLLIPFSAHLKLHSEQTSPSPSSEQIPKLMFTPPTEESNLAREHVGEENISALKLLNRHLGPYAQAHHATMPVRGFGRWPLWALIHFLLFFWMFLYITNTYSLFIAKLVVIAVIARYLLTLL